MAHDPSRYSFYAAPHSACWSSDTNGLGTDGRASYAYSYSSFGRTFRAAEEVAATQVEMVRISRECQT